MRAADTDSGRLERLERAIQVLQERNAELEKEVNSLKATKRAVEPRASSAAVIPARGEEEGKAVAALPAAKEEKKPVTVIAAASELKLTLGGFIQTQFEAGDVLAFEGRFGAAEIDDRFRIRRARIAVTGDYAEQFDFKLEGEFALSDTALTLRDGNGRSLGSNSTRTSFGGLDLSDELAPAPPSSTSRSANTRRRLVWSSLSPTRSSSLRNGVSSPQR